VADVVVVPIGSGVGGHELPEDIGADGLGPHLPTDLIPPPAKLSQIRPHRPLLYRRTAGKTNWPDQAK